jgi:PBP1b-binding outer membrane lipoprotein LpoB
MYITQVQKDGSFKTVEASPEEFIKANDKVRVAIEKQKLEAAKVFEAKQANKKAALEKLAKVAGLTDDEVAALV